MGISSRRRLLTRAEAEGEDADEGTQVAGNQQPTRPPGVKGRSNLSSAKPGHEGVHAEDPPNGAGGLMSQEVPRQVRLDHARRVLDAERRGQSRPSTKHYQPRPETPFRIRNVIAVVDEGSVSRWRTRRQTAQRGCMRCMMFMALLGQHLLSAVTVAVVQVAVHSQ